MPDGCKVELGLGKDGGLPLDLAAGIEDGGMVAAAEDAPDLSEGLIGVVAEEVHGDVAGSSDALGTGLAVEGLVGDIEVRADGVDDSVGSGDRALHGAIGVLVEGIFG